MLFEAILISLIMGKLRGGKFKSIGRITIRRPWFFFLSFVIELGTLFAISAGFEIVKYYSVYLHALSYVLLFVALAYNVRHRAVWVILLGALLNFLVLFMNGGLMPISTEGLTRAGLTQEAQIVLSGGMVSHKAVTESTRLQFLAERIVLPPPYPFPKILSIGDIAISLGIGLLIYNTMLREKHTKKSRMIRFKYKGRKLRGF